MATQEPNVYAGLSVAVRGLMHARPRMFAKVMGELMFLARRGPLRACGIWEPESGGSRASPRGTCRVLRLLTAHKPGQEEVFSRTTTSTCPPIPRATHGAVISVPSSCPGHAIRATFGHGASCRARPASDDQARRHGLLDRRRRNGSVRLVLPTYDCLMVADTYERGSTGRRGACRRDPVGRPLRRGGDRRRRRGPGHSPFDGLAEQDGEFLRKAQDRVVRPLLAAGVRPD